MYQTIQITYMSFSEWRRELHVHHICFTESIRKTTLFLENPSNTVMWYWVVKFLWRTSPFSICYTIELLLNKMLHRSPWACRRACWMVRQAHRERTHFSGNTPYWATTLISYATTIGVVVWMEHINLPCCPSKIEKAEEGKFSRLQTCHPPKTQYSIPEYYCEVKLLLMGRSTKSSCWPEILPCAKTHVLSS